MPTPRVRPLGACIVTLASIVCGCTVYDASMLSQPDSGGTGGGASLPTEAGTPRDVEITDAVRDAAPETKSEAGQRCDKIDDFEHTGKDQSPVVCNQSGRWLVLGSRTAGGKNNPEPVFPSARDPALPGNASALHFWGTGQDQGGVGISFNDWPLPARPVNASGDVGLTFWARAGATNDTTPWYLLVSDRTTNPAGGICGVDGGGACFDDFGASLDKLTTDWIEFTVAFKDLMPGALGFGNHGDALDTTTVYSVAFKTVGGFAATFDIWVDDLYFVCTSADCRPTLLPDGAPF